MTRNSCTSIIAQISSFVTSVITIGPLVQKKFQRSYLKVVYYLHKKFANNTKILKVNFKILNYIQPMHMISMYHVDELKAVSCKVTDVFENLLSTPVSLSVLPLYLSQPLKRLIYVPTSIHNRLCLKGKVAIGISTDSNWIGLYKQSSRVQQEIKNGFFIKVIWLFNLVPPESNHERPQDAYLDTVWVL